VFVSALDQNVAATAMPRIVGELGGAALYAWVFAAYMLTSTLSVPIAGRLGDLRGRRGLLLAGIAILVAGCLPAALAPGMGVLICARGLQGIGGGLVQASAFALLGEIYPPRERGRLMGLFSGIFALASIAGPLLGGIVADRVGWRWVFALDLPLGLGAALLCRRHLPRREHRPGERPPRLDVPGALLLIAAVVPLLLALPSRSRHATHALDALRGPALLLSAAMFVLLALVERRAAQPLLPPVLFTRRNFVAAAAAAFVSGAGLFATAVFVPLFVQGGLHKSATEAGLTLLPMTLGLVAGSIFGGRVIAATGSLRGLGCCGFALSFVSLVALSMLTAQTQLRTLMLELLFFGLGLGLALPTLTLAIQGAVDREHLGVATSLSTFSRTLGGSLGVAALGALLPSELSAALAPALSRVFAVAAGLFGIGGLCVLLIRGGPEPKTDESQRIIEKTDGSRAGPRDENPDLARDENRDLTR
jgi:EmrB/QacA subfamily drug resistance transporter